MEVMYSLLAEGEFEDVLNGLSREFQTQETMGKCLKLDENDYEELKKAFKPILKYGYTLVAKDRATNEVIGAMICADFYDLLFKDSTPSQSQKLNAIFSLLGTLESRFLKLINKSVTKNEYFYLYALYVKKNLNSKHVGSTLLDRAQNLAVEMGFKYSFALATGAASQHIVVSKLKYKLIDQIEYKSFEFNGKRVFESITSTPSCQLLFKEIDRNQPNDQKNKSNEKFNNNLLNSTNNHILKFKVNQENTSILNLNRVFNRKSFLNNPNLRNPINNIRLVNDCELKIFNERIPKMLSRLCRGFKMASITISIAFCTLPVCKNKFKVLWK